MPILAGMGQNGWTLLLLLASATAQAEPLRAPVRALKAYVGIESKPAAPSLDSEMLAKLNGIQLYGLEGRSALSLKPDFCQGPMAALSLRF